MNNLYLRCILMVGFLLQPLLTESSLFARDIRPNNTATENKIDSPLWQLKLLPGYQHEKSADLGGESGRLVKADGLSISYNILAVPPPGFAAGGGGGGGSSLFVDLPKRIPKKDRHWYKEQTVSHLPIHIVYTKRGYLHASVQNKKKGISFTAKIKNEEEIADIILMLMTFTFAKNQ